VRFVYIPLIVTSTAIVLLFKFQNLEAVTVSLFSARVSLPNVRADHAHLCAGHVHRRIRSQLAALVDTWRVQA